MNLLYSFLAVGLICGLASLIHDFTKLTPGHITSIFVVIGSFLGVFDLYDLLIKKVGVSLFLPITSFGNSLIKSSYQGYLDNGFFGIFSNMFNTTSLGISFLLIFGFIIALFCKVKD